MSEQELDRHQQGGETKQKFNDFQLHVEFILPFKPFARFQERGNSGIYIQRRYETQVLAACTTAKPREGIDFFPLTIDVEERMYAAGKIPGGFFRREGRPSETATLTARLIDRPLRPSFKGGFRVLITGPHGFERAVAFAIDDDPAVIAERVRETMEE